MGKWPACGTPEWEQLVALAEDGRVRLAPVFLIGDDDYLCEDVVEKRLRARAAEPPAYAPAGNPLNLRDDLRKMGLLLRSVVPYPSAPGVRMARVLTQRELFELTGVPQADISRIERGVGNPTEVTWGSSRPPWAAS